MKPVVQTRFGGGMDVPAPERGNCFAACLASILELPLGLDEGGVPDLPADDEHWDAIMAWLHDRGLHLMFLGPPPHGHFWPGYTLGGVRSAIIAPEQGGHMVVCLDGVPVFNPNPTDARDLAALDVEMFAALMLIDPAPWFGDRQHLSATPEPGKVNADIPVPYPNAGKDLGLAALSQFTKISKEEKFGG